MRRVIVLNTKGGCGKTTVATNIAACYAARGYSTTLLDYDPQGSSLGWLKARPGDAPRITGVNSYDSSRPPLSGAWQMQVPRDTQRVVVDTQGGIRATDLVGRVRPDDLLLIPIQASAMDIRASADFIRDLLLTAKIRYDNGRIGIIANRVREHSKSLDLLERFLDTLKIPVIAKLRDAPQYLQAADDGLGVYELPVKDKFRDQWLAWRNILRWLERDAADQDQPLADSGRSSRPQPIIAQSEPAPRPAPAPLESEPESDSKHGGKRIPSFLTLPPDQRHQH